VLLPRQTLILETDWNVPQPEPARKKLLGWVPSPRLPKKRAHGPRRLVLVTPVDYYAEQYARARLTGDPVVETSRIEWENEPRTPSSTDTPQIQALLRAVLYLQQSGHRDEAAAVYAEVKQLRSTVRSRQVANQLAEQQQESAALTQRDTAGLAASPDQHEASPSTPKLN